MPDRDGHPPSDRLPTGLVWDLPTRLFHWLLVVAVATSFASVELDAMETHMLSGGVVLGLLLFRLMWGIWGASTAQFHRFVPTPGRLVASLRSHAAHTGHTPLGALSVLAMLGVLCLQVATGLVSDDEIFYEGPLRSYVTAATSRAAVALHETSSDVLLALVALHLGAILFYRYARGRRLVPAMLHGRGEIGAGPARDRPLWLAALTALSSAAVVYVIYRM